MMSKAEPAGEKPVLDRRREAGAPFDASFFLTAFADRISARCSAESKDVPVLLLDLANGETLDVCHIDLLADSWMAVSAFRDVPSCDHMDVVFVPYRMITLITLTRRDLAERHVGFMPTRPDHVGGSGTGSPEEVEEKAPWRIPEPV